MFGRWNSNTACYEQSRLSVVKRPTSHHLGRIEIKRSRMESRTGSVDHHPIFSGDTRAATRISDGESSQRKAGVSVVCRCDRYQSPRDHGTL